MIEGDAAYVANDNHAAKLFLPGRKGFPFLLALPIGVDVIIDNAVALAALDDGSQLKPPTFDY